MGLSQSQIRIAHLPHCVYKAYNAKGELLYVGVSVNPRHRLREHRKYSRWYDETAVIRVWEFPTRFAALDEEARCIAEDMPQHNVTQEKRQPEHRRRDPQDGYALVPEPFIGWAYRELDEIEEVADA